MFTAMLENLSLIYTVNMTKQNPFEWFHFRFRDYVLQTTPIHTQLYKTYLTAVSIVGAAGDCQVNITENWQEEISACGQFSSTACI